MIISPSPAFAVNGEVVTEVNSLAHDTNSPLNGVNWNSLVQVDSDTYALAYEDNEDDGIISTFTISADGNTITEVQSIEHEGVLAQYNSFVQVDSDTYALAYSGGDNDGWIKTFTIPVDGSTITEVKSLEHDMVKGIYNSLVQVDDDTYALAYSDSANGGRISTFTISADGNTLTEVNSVQHDAGGGVDNSFVKVDADTYALAYQGTGGNRITTFTINPTTATIQKENSLLYDAGVGRDNSLVQIDSDTYAVAHRDASDDGFITTFTIDPTTATITELVSLEHDTIKAVFPLFVKVDSNTFALAYQGNVGLDGFIKTFTIPSDGSSITEITTLTHDTSSISYNSFVQVDSDTYALAYTDGDLDGYIKTFTITSASITSSSSGGDNTAPTLGTGTNGQRLIDNGFSYNNNPIDVANFHTDYPLVRTEIGQTNTLDLKILENQGMNYIEFISVHFGVPQIHAQGEAIATYYPSLEKIKIHDPNNLLDNIDIKMDSVKCKEIDDKESCVKFSFEHSFNEAPLHDIVRVTLADKTRNHSDVFFNDGIEVYGESLNPPDMVSIASQGKERGLVHLTQIDRANDVWIDQYENKWTRNLMGGWIKQSFDEFAHPDDGPIGMNGYKRTHPHFDAYLKGQELYAKQVWDGVLIQSQIPDFIPDEPRTETLRSENPQLQADKLAQIEQAKQWLYEKYGFE